jgi:transposase InsO family protein
MRRKISLKVLLMKMKAETGRETKILRSDGGGEYCSKDFENCLAKAGITHQGTPSYTP